MFVEWAAKLQAQFASVSCRVDSSSKRLVCTVKPQPARLPEAVPGDMLVRVGTAGFDSDNDLTIMLLTASGDQYCYDLRLMSPSQDLGLSVPECRALAKLFHFAEVGDRMTKDTFLATGFILKQEVNLVKYQDVQKGSSHVHVVVIVPTTAEIEEPVDPALVAAFQAVRKQGELRAVQEAINAQNQPLVAGNPVQASYPPGSRSGQIALALDNGHCTFPVTGREFVRQPWWVCTTCHFGEGQGCCASCRKQCHAGHEGYEKDLGADGAFCDCGAGEIRHFPCKCLPIGFTAGPPSFPGVKYTTGKPITESGQGDVYQGQFNGKSVAVKVFKNVGDQTEFKAELKSLLVAGQHASVVPILEWFDSPQYAIVMPFYTDGNLREYLDAHQQQNPGRPRLLTDKATLILTRLADGLAYLHQFFVHRDLKSLNVMMENGETPVIIDMGLGIEWDPAKTQQQVQTANAKGSFLWMSPEMMVSASYSDKSDVFAFAIIMWEILAVGLPYQQQLQSPATMLQRIASGSLRPDVGACNGEGEQRPTLLLDLMTMCWAQDPTDRPRMSQVKESLIRSTPIQQRCAQDMFKEADTSSSGELSFADFVVFLQKFAPGQVKKSDVHRLFDVIDTDGGGTIDFDEFSKWWAVVERSGVGEALSIGSKASAAAAGSDKVSSPRGQANIAAAIEAVSKEGKSSKIRSVSVAHQEEESWDDLPPPPEPIDPANVTQEWRSVLRTAGVNPGDLRDGATAAVLLKTIDETILTLSQQQPASTPPGDARPTGFLAQIGQPHQLRHVATKNRLRDKPPNGMEQALVNAVAKVMQQRRLHLASTTNS